MTSLLHPPVFRVAGQHANRVLLASEAGATVEIFVLEDDIVRVRVLPDATARNPRTWSIAPGLEDVPLDGRDRLDLSGFALPSFTLVEDDDSVCIETVQIRLAVHRQGGHCTWSMRDADGTWRVALADRATQTYNFGWWDDRAYHYVARERGDKVFGLGERAGDLDRTGARFEMRNIDAMGYSAKHTDPLYKHIPFYITWSPAACQGFGLFYDTLSDCAFDMGREPTTITARTAISSPSTAISTTTSSRRPTRRSRPRGASPGSPGAPRARRNGRLLSRRCATPMRRTRSSR